MIKSLIIAGFLLTSFISQSQQISKWKIEDVDKQIRSDTTGVVIFNFWATFCKPCIAEIPGFIKVSNNYKNDVKLILVSLDLASYYPDKIAAFTKKHRFNADLAWLAETNADYFCPAVDSSWSGSIPATLMVNRKTGKRFFMEGEMAEAEFEAAIKNLLK